ncbi:MAG: CBS domain-containing protein [Emergencia sp.]
MTVKELMSSNVCFVTGDASVSHAAALMKQQNIGFVPVCDNNGGLLGAVTDRDLLLRVLASGRDPVSTKVCEIMTEKVTVLTGDMDIHDAACVFSKEKVRRLPVLENGRLAGILSVCDMARRRLYLAEVGDIMGALAKQDR